MWDGDIAKAGPRRSGSNEPEPTMAPTKPATTTDPIYATIAAAVAAIAALMDKKPSEAIAAAANTLRSIEGKLEALIFELTRLGEELPERNYVYRVVEDLSSYVGTYKNTYRAPIADGTWGEATSINIFARLAELRDRVRDQKGDRVSYFPVLAFANAIEKDFTSILVERGFIPQTMADFQLGLYVAYFTGAEQEIGEELSPRNDRRKELERLQGAIEHVREYDYAYIPAGIGVFEQHRTEVRTVGNMTDGYSVEASTSITNVGNENPSGDEAPTNGCKYRHAETLVRTWNNWNNEWKSLASTVGMLEDALMVVTTALEGAKGYLSGSTN